MSHFSQSPAPGRTAEPSPERWFADEVHLHGPQLKAYLRGAFPALRDDADDVVQESFLRIWRARAAQPINSAKAFLFQVARHLALDTLRKGRNSPFESMGSLDESRVLDTGPNAIEALITKDTLHHLADAIAALPDRCRDVLVLHKLKGLSHREVATELGLSVRTVEKYYLKALKRCESHLSSRGIKRFYV